MSCLKLRCEVADKSKEKVISQMLQTVPQWAAGVRKLRYFALEIGLVVGAHSHVQCNTMSHAVQQDTDFEYASWSMPQENGGGEAQYWWEIDRSGDAPTAKRLPIWQGEQIASGFVW